ncbi:L,D-transpeptidase family protein [Erythrobacter sp.]|uniref:L,D-transpeptidase family protein n=1 Tax=Erythrobacter sp. TaxID=1042 RepID=UPI001425C4C5|nr:L,D-transpeptidase family protein [Erythrobacter sp.]QIQ86973.1 MAG: L,D-transpeptidase family protein [Erythrobacter sp.]
MTKLAPRLAVSGLAAALAFGALSAATGLVAAQESDARASADRAVEAAGEVREALGEIRAVDPDTMGPSLVVDPSLPQPYGADLAPGEQPQADLPPIAGNEDRSPRGPATRMVASPVVQALPAPEAAPAAPAASDDPFVIKSILPIEGTIRYGEWFWDDSAAPAEGPLVITVDLDARVISAFRGGHEIGTAVALLGTKRHPTPLGTFPILTKEKDNISEKYNNAPMPWTLRLTWDGIAIHGSPVINGYASHGCIGVPDPFAKKLFEAAKRGDKVVITRGRYVGVGDRILS